MIGGNYLKLQKLLDTLRVSTEDLYWILIEELKTLGLTAEFEHDQWIYVNNSSPIMLVAHMDTITRNHQLKFRVKRNLIRARNSVLGADDRAGVYAIIELLTMCHDQSIPMPSVLFTNYEESGLMGVDAFVTAKRLDVAGLNLFVELDRKGRDEFVCYFYTINDKLKRWVESFGFRKEWGSISDVASLTEEYHIPHVNLSVGYYDQHSTRERLNTTELQETINKVFRMIKQPIDVLYPAEPSTRYYGCYGNGYQDYDCYGFDTNYSRHQNERYQPNYTRSATDTYDVTYFNRTKLVPKTFRYYPISDLLMEEVYELDASDIPWEDDEAGEVDEADIHPELDAYTQGKTEYDEWIEEQEISGDIIDLESDYDPYIGNPDQDGNVNYYSRYSWPD